MERPEGLRAGGATLWDSIAGAHELDAMQVVQLTEACRMKDRLDEFDEVIRGKGVLNLMRFRMEDIDAMAENPEATVVVKFDAVIDKANTTANTMKQLLAALRLPDAAGNRPQQRGGARGAYGAQTPGGKESTKVSSLDRARARKRA